MSRPASILPLLIRRSLSQHALSTIVTALSVALYALAHRLESWVRARWR